MTCGKGILKTARELKVGSGTVQRVKREIAVASGKGVIKTARELKVGSGTLQRVKRAMVEQG